MKLPTKPISSPGRTDNYPPPLMRFLRTNVGSKSRGRSRSSPMFFRKKNAAAGPPIETQEPSSPKVTCMGQIRVNRSTTRPGKAKHRCKWIRNSLSRRRFAGKLKPKCSKPDWRKWVMFFHCGFKRKSKIREASPKIEPKLSYGSEDIDDEFEETDDDERNSAMAAAKDYFSTAVSPPKNALILTRSRSAPYRSSSLAYRFWGSPVSNEEEKTEQKINDEDEILSVPPANEILCKEMKLEAESEEIESQSSSISEKAINPSKIEEELETEEDEIEKRFQIVHPLILTRCKSEPARIGEKLDPEFSFLKNTRLGFT